MRNSNDYVTVVLNSTLPGRLKTLQLKQVVHANV